MSKNVDQLKLDRARLISQTRDILDVASADNQRSLTAEEAEKFDKITVDIDAIDGTLERQERMNAFQAPNDRVSTPRNEASNKIVRGFQTPMGELRDQVATDEYSKVFWRYARQGNNAMTREDYNLLNECRALSVGTNASGGFTVPTDFINELVVALREKDVMRRLGRVIRTETTSTQIPIASSHGAAQWLAEAGSYTESDETYSQVTLGANKAGTIIKVSEELLADSAFDIQQYLVGEFASRFATIEEAAFVNGDGASKPTGILNAVSHGVTGATQNSISFDDLIDLQYSLPSQYDNNARWLLSRNAARDIRKIKDSNNNYIWQPSMVAGTPDTLLGHEVFTSSNVEDNGTTGNVYAVYADFGYYWIGDRGLPEFQRLDELYAATGQVGFRGHIRVDGKHLLADTGRSLTSP